MLDDFKKIKHNDSLHILAAVALSSPEKLAEAEKIVTKAEKSASKEFDKILSTQHKEFSEKEKDLTPIRTAVVQLDKEIVATISTSVEAPVKETLEKAAVYLDKPSEAPTPE